MIKAIWFLSIRIKKGNSVPYYCLFRVNRSCYILPSEYPPGIPLLYKARVWAHFIFWRNSIF